MAERVSATQRFYRGLRSHDRLIARRIERGLEMGVADPSGRARALAVRLRRGDVSVALRHRIRMADYAEQKEVRAALADLERYYGPLLDCEGMGG